MHKIKSDVLNYNLYTFFTVLNYRIDLDLSIIQIYISIFFHDINKLLYIDKQ
jgi:hypothetical protein